MKNLILLSLLFSFIFAGCTPKTQIVFNDKLVCNEQTKLEKIEDTKIRVHPLDLAVSKTYSTTVRGYISFYEKQVDDNNKLCKELKNGN
jgi:uncharacterized protein YcfL